MVQQIFLSIEISELQDLLEQAVSSGIEKALADTNHKEREEILTREQIANLYGVSLPTVNDWMNKGYLPFYRMNRKVYFKRTEVLNAMVKAGKHRKDNTVKGGANKKGL